MIIKKKKGFTLIELIVIISILAVLALLAVPGYTGIIKKSHESVIKSNCRTVLTASQVFLSINNDENTDENTFANEEIQVVKSESNVSGNIDIVKYKNNTITYLEYTNIKEKLTAVYDITKDPNIFIKDSASDISIISNYKSILDRLIKENKKNVNSALPNWLKDVNFNDLSADYKTKVLQQEILNENKNKYLMPDKNSTDTLKKLLLKGIYYSALPSGVSENEFKNNPEKYLYCKPIVSDDGQNVVNIFTTNNSSLGNVNGIFIQYKDNYFYHTHSNKNILSDNYILDKGNISKELDKMIADPTYVYDKGSSGKWHIK